MTDFSSGFLYGWLFGVVYVTALRLLIQKLDDPRLDEWGKR